MLILFSKFASVKQLNFTDMLFRKSKMKIPFGVYVVCAVRLRDSEFQPPRFDPLHAFVNYSDAKALKISLYEEMGLFCKIIKVGFE